MNKMILLIFVILFISSLLYSEGPDTVNLGTAQNYVVLAKTGVSATGNTSIVGDIGLSPAAATYITGFDLIMDPSGTYSISELITGNIYSADYTSPTPANLLTATNDFDIAFSDAAGRLNPDFTELYAGDLTGQTLSPGLYKWGSGVLIGAGGVTISGSSNDVWIFQIAQNLTVAETAIISLSGGAQAGNIFWQISGETTIGTTAQFKGIVLCQTNIAMNTGASLNGRLMAKTAVTMIANNIVKSSIPIIALDRPVITSIMKTAQGVEITWNPVQNSNSYIVYDANFPDSGFSEIATVETTSYTFTENNIRKFFKIKASTDY